MHNEKIFTQIIDRTKAAPVNSVDVRFQQCHKGFCLAHEDSSPSFTVGIDQNENISINCHAGCTHETLLTSLHLSEIDLQSPSKKKRATISPLVKSLPPTTIWMKLEPSCTR